VVSVACEKGDDDEDPEGEVEEKTDEEEDVEEEIALIRGCLSKFFFLPEGFLFVDSDFCSVRFEEDVTVVELGLKVEETEDETDDSLSF
jgi:hypothetical protein